MYAHTYNFFLFMSSDLLNSVYNFSSIIIFVYKFMYLNLHNRIVFRFHIKWPFNHNFMLIFIFTCKFMHLNFFFKYKTKLLIWIYALLCNTINVYNILTITCIHTYNFFLFRNKKTFNFKNNVLKVINWII